MNQETFALWSHHVFPGGDKRLRENANEIWNNIEKPHHMHILYKRKLKKANDPPPQVLSHFSIKGKDCLFWSSAEKNWIYFWIYQTLLASWVLLSRICSCVNQVFWIIIYIAPSVFIEVYLIPWKAYNVTFEKGGKVKWSSIKLSENQ